MLERCYGEKFLERQPTYKGCTVDDEWKCFMNFRGWMEQQKWEGLHLDKDILVLGNKEYCPSRCVFIHPVVNTFTIDGRSTRGYWPLGVSFQKSAQKFAGQCSNPFKSDRGYLGLFTDPVEAHYAWQDRKHELACLLADSEYVTDERVAAALRLRYAPGTDWLEGWTPQ